MTTKIKYKFINGEVLEVEVDDIIAAFILKDRTREASANRKERRYNFSLETALYEDVKFYATPEGNPDQRMIQFEQYEEILKFIETLTEVQKRRLFMRLQVCPTEKLPEKNVWLYVVWQIQLTMCV